MRDLNKLNREIKFRAWGKQTGKGNKMWHNVQDRSNLHDWLRIFKEKGTPKIMQYTGLKDKNNVEIYEGDILYFHANNTKCIVKLDLKNIIKCFLIEDDHCIRILKSKWIEVIGNIYENPELVKGEQ